MTGRRWLLGAAALITLSTALFWHGGVSAALQETERMLHHPDARLGTSGVLALLELGALTSLFLGLVGSFVSAVGQPVIGGRLDVRMSHVGEVPRPVGRRSARPQASVASPPPTWEKTAMPLEPTSARPLQPVADPAPEDLLPSASVEAPRGRTSRYRAAPAVRLEDPEWTRAVLGLVNGEGAGQPCPIALSLNADAVEVRYALPKAQAVPPFELVDGTVWRLKRTAGMLAELPDTRAIVAASRRSALVTVCRSDANRMLLDLVATKSVALDGPPVAVGATLSDLVVELATRRWSDLDELIVVGFGSELVGLDGVHCLSSADEARAYLLAATSTGHRTAWGRCLIVAPPVGSGPSVGDSSIRSLVDLTETLPDTGLVCCDPSVAAVRVLWRLQSHRQTAAVAIRWPGRSIEELSLGSETSIEEADISFEPVRCLRPPSEPVAESVALEPPPVDDSVLVRVLGPVDVQNASDVLGARRRITEVIVYLAMHPEGSSGEALSTAVWPDRRVPTQTVANRLSEARRMLGVTSSGQSRLGRVAGRHVLQGVDTDWHRFETLTGSEADLSSLLQAIELIRGRPFEGLSETGWALLEGYIATMEARISEVATRAATAALDRGEIDVAERAVRRCLLAAPWDERLYRMLMTVCHAAGNRGGVEEALRSLARVLEWQGEPVEGVHPETARLYRQLMSS